MFDMFISAFSSACSMEALVANFIGVALGIVFGALPVNILLIRAGIKKGM